MRCTLDGARAFAVVGLLDRPTGSEFVSADSAAGLFRVGWSRGGRRPGKLRWAEAGAAESRRCIVRHDGADFVFRFSHEPAMRVVCRFRADPACGGLVSSLRIFPREDSRPSRPPVIERVAFPAIGFRIDAGGGARADSPPAVAAGITKGGLFPIGT